MAFPEVVAISTYNSPSADSDEPAIAMPSGIQRGDLIFILHVEQRDGGGPGNLVIPDGWWQLWRRDQSTALCQLFYRVADGTESGTTVTWNGFNSTGEVCVVYVIRGADPLVGPYCSTGNTGASGTNPDAPGRIAPWGIAENLFFDFAGGPGNTVITGTPQNDDGSPYSDNIALANSFSSNAVAMATAHTRRLAGSDNPTTRGRTSGAWLANTVVVPPVLQSDAAQVRVRFCQTMHVVTSGSPDQVTVHVEGGSHTRVVMCMKAFSLPPGDSFTATLDPDGANIPLTLVTDGVTSATTADSLNEGARVYTTLATQDLSPGDYTLRFTGGYTGTFSIHWLELENTKSVTEAIEVKMFLGGSNSDDTTIQGELGGLVLAFFGHVGGMIGMASNHRVNDLPMQARGCYARSEANDAPDCGVAVGRTIDGENAIHLQISPPDVTNWDQDAMLITFGAAAQLVRYNAPLVGSG